MTAEQELRALWTYHGVPQERQDQLIADITAKAQPGAMVGPFRIGYRSELTAAGEQLVMFDPAEPRPDRGGKVQLCLF